MNTARPLVAWCLIAAKAWSQPSLLALLVWSSIASAAPVTFYFEGTTTAYTNYATGGSDPSAIGVPISGSVTFDISNAETYSSFDIPGFGAATRAESAAGCGFFQNGVCNFGFGSGNPVVTSFSVFAPFGPASGYQKLIAGDGFREFTEVSKNRNYPFDLAPTGNDTYLISDQVEHAENVFTDDTRTTLVSSAQRLQSFDISSIVDNNTLLDPMGDLTVLPVFANGVFTLRFLDADFSAHCTANGCRNTNTGVAFDATLSVLQVPEPDALALLLAALAACALIRRQPKVTVPVS
jgi:hypothetical protein